MKVLNILLAAGVVLAATVSARADDDDMEELLQANLLTNSVLGTRKSLPEVMKDLGGHGCSHAYLTDDFIRGILVPGHKVCVDVVTALNTTVAGVYAHLSAMKGGEVLKIPAIG